MQVETFNCDYECALNGALCGADRFSGQGAGHCTCVGTQPGMIFEIEFPPEQNATYLPTTVNKIHQEAREM